MAEPRVLVTGATGHLGVNLVRALLGRGHRVRALVRANTRPLAGLDVELVRGDIRDRASLTPACADVEVVYHVAGAIAVSEARRAQVEAINIGGAQNVADAALASGARRLVHCSTVRVFRDSPHGPIDESSPLRDEGEPGPVYARSKAAGERRVLDAVGRGLDAVIVNPTGIIGPHDHGPSRVGELLVALARGRMRVITSGGWDFGDARDMADAMIAAADRGRCGQRYILSGHWRSLVELAALVAELTGARTRRLCMPIALARPFTPFAALLGAVTRTEPKFTRQSLEILETGLHVSHARASRELDYRPRPPIETIRDTLAWFRERGRLP